MGFEMFFKFVLGYWLLEKVILGKRVRLVFDDDIIIYFFEII